MKFKRGDVYLTQLDPTVGSEIQKTRPSVIVSNDISNLHSPLVTILPLTTQKLEKLYPFEVLLSGIRGLSKNSKVKANQIRTLDKKRLIKKLASLPKKEILQIEEALRIHLQL